MNSDDALPLSLEQKVDQVCTRFEAAWKSGAQPRIEDHVADLSDAEKREVVRELILLDVFYRRQRGDSCRPEDYQPRFPEIEPAWLAQALDPAASAPLKPTVDEPRLVERPGSRIGSYKLLQQIGEGGMGTVFMAEQTHPVQRKVALKLIKIGMDSRQVIARFEAERQALALMDHPNIAKVFDARTTESGRPYFVMELVKGVPITRYCDEHHLTPSERLELFVPVCQVVQHAHHKGVIHRDMKPSNVMVCIYDGKPVPKVIDFGVAKATGPKLTERTLYTEFGAIVGTFEYMRPEQAQLDQPDIDTRSDVYSLGVLLYELLTGTTPLERGRMKEVAILELLRLIREEEAPRPSTRLSTTEGLPSIAANRGTEPKRLSGLVRGELDWIVLKALEKDRNRRYETANALAADVLRYLHDEAVQACPPSLSYRLKKFARRNKGPVLAAAGFAALVLLGIGGLIAGLVALQAEQRHTADALEQVQQEQARTQQALVAEGERAEGEKKAKQQALTAAEDEKKANAQAQKRLAQIQKWNVILSSVFTDLDPRAEEKLGKPLLRILGDRIAKVAEQLEGESVGDPLLVAGLQERLGQSLLDLGMADRAIALFVKARASCAASLGADHPDTLTKMANLARGYKAAGKLDLALPLLEETLKLMKAKLGADDPNTLASMNNLANGYQHAGKLDLALPLLEETLKLQQTKLGADHPNTLSSMNNLADGYRAAGKLDLALPLLEETLKLRKAKLGADHPDTLNSMDHQALGYQSAGKLDLALPLLEETLKLRKAKLGADHPDTLNSMDHQALGYWAAGKLDLALPLLEETLKLRKAELGADHPDTLSSMNNLAVGYQSAGKLDLALPLWEETNKLMKVKLGADHPDTLKNMGSLAAGYRSAGKLDLALPLLEETFKLMKAKLGADHPDTLTSMGNVAGGYWAAGKLDLALPLLEETFKLRKAKLGVDHPNTLVSMNDLAFGYRDAGKLDQALPLLEETLKLQKAKLGADHPHRLTSMNNLAMGYESAGKLDQALPLFEETLKLTKAKLGADHPDTLVSMNNLAFGYRDAGKVDQALPLLKEAAAGIEKRRFRHEYAGRIVSNLISCHEQLKQLDQAEAWRRKWLAVVKERAGAYSLPYAGELAGLGGNLLQQKKWNDAEAVLRECLPIREKKSPDEWTTFNTKSMLGGALLGQKKYADAEPLLVAGYEGMKQREAKISPQGKLRLTEALERLPRVYDEWGKPGEAAKWRKKLAPSKVGIVPKP